MSYLKNRKTVTEMQWERKAVIKQYWEKKGPASEDGLVNRSKDHLCFIVVVLGQYVLITCYKFETGNETSNFALFSKLF